MGESKHYRYFFQSIPTRTVLGVICAVLITHLSSGTAFSQATPKAQIPKLVHEFGTVAEGVAVEHDFIIANNGSAELEIRKILPACGCTAAVVSSEKIAAGQSTRLKVRFDTGGFRGYKVKTIRVFTNDPNSNSIVFSLKGTVEPTIVLSPTRVQFGSIRKGASPVQEIAISSTRRDLVIAEVRPRSDLLKIEKLTDSAGMRFRVKLDPAAPLGIFRSRIALQTNDPVSPVVNVPVYAKVLGDLKLSPSGLSFGLIEAPITAPLTQSVSLASQSEKPISILSLESDHPNISATYKVVEPGKRFTLDVTVSGNIVGALRGKIKITTDHDDPSQQELLLPVYAIISRPN